MQTIQKFTIALLIFYFKFMLCFVCADENICEYAFSVRNPLEMEVFGEFLYPYVLSNNKKVYFKCIPERKMYLALNYERKDSLFIKNRNSLNIEKIKVLNYTKNEKEYFIDIDIKINNTKLFFINESSQGLVLKDKKEINNKNIKKIDDEGIKTNEIIHKKSINKGLPDDIELNYKPSIEIDLNIIDNDENEEKVKNNIKEKIENAFDKKFEKFKDNNILNLKPYINQVIAKSYIKKQFIDKKYEKNAIQILEKYYEKLIDIEDKHIKNFKQKYTELNNKLIVKRNDIYIKINTLKKKCDEFRELNEQIRSKQRDKIYKLEKITINKNGIESEKQMFKGDLESQSTYGLFVVIVKDQGSFNETDEKLSKIFNFIGLEELSEVYISSESKICNDILISNTTKQIKTGIINMTGSREIYKALDSDGKTLAVKIIKYTPYKIDDKSEKGVITKEEYQKWYIKNQSDIDIFLEKVKPVINDEKHFLNIKKDISEMLNDVKNKNQKTYESRSKLAEKVKNMINKRNKIIEELNNNIKQIDNEIKKLDNEKPILIKNYQLIRNDISNLMNKFSILDQKVIKTIHAGNKIKIYEFSNKPAGSEESKLAPFLKVSFDMFDKIFKKSRVVHKTLQTTLSNGLFMKQKETTVNLNKTYYKANFYLDVPHISNYPFPCYAIAEIIIQIDSPHFQRQTSIKDKMSEDINKIDNDFHYELENKEVNSKKIIVAQKPSILDKLTKKEPIIKQKQEIKIKNNQKYNKDNTRNKYIKNIQNLIKRQDVIKINKLIYSLEYFNKTDDQIYFDFVITDQIPKKVANNYNCENIKDWRLPTKNEIELLLKNCSDSIKNEFKDTKIFIDEKTKENKFAYILVTKDFMLKQRYSSRNDFVNFIFVKNQ